MLWFNTCLFALNQATQTAPQADDACRRAQNGLSWAGGHSGHSMYMFQPQFGRRWAGRGHGDASQPQLAHRAIVADLHARGQVALGHHLEVLRVVGLFQIWADQNRVARCCLMRMVSAPATDTTPG